MTETESMHRLARPQLPLLTGYCPAGVPAARWRTAPHRASRTWSTTTAAPVRRPWSNGLCSAMRSSIGHRCLWPQLGHVARRIDADDEIVDLQAPLDAVREVGAAEVVVGLDLVLRAAAMNGVAHLIRPRRVRAGMPSTANRNVRFYPKSRHVAGAVHSTRLTHCGSPSA